MIGHDVVIAGGGPTGLMLAGELALAGIDVAIVERRTGQEVDGSRAGGLHPRTLEVLDQRGIADRFLAEGRKHPKIPFAETFLDISDLPTRHAYSLGLWQSRIEHHLAGWIGEMAVTVYRGREITGFVEDGTGVEVELADGEALRARYLVGCDGGRSLVRKLAGIAFEGWAPTVSSLIFEAVPAEEPAWGIRYSERGINALGPLDDGRRVRGVLTEPRLKQDRVPVEDELREALFAAYGTDFGIHQVNWLSRFTDAARQADAYRKGRILLAGDAAHVHSPAGGQGLNIGLRDAVNLGWKLAQTVNGVTGEAVLDSYHAERHPVGERLLRNTRALSALQRGDAATATLRDFLATPMQTESARRWYGATVAGLDERYDIGDGHPLLGCRMPDMDLATAGGGIRVSSLLNAARPVLLNFGGAGALDIGAWSDRVRLVDAQAAGPWELPLTGEVAPPAAVLIRPDGHVAWVGEGEDRGLAEALGFWFGAAHGPN